MRVRPKQTRAENEECLWRDPQTFQAGIPSQAKQIGHGPAFEEWPVAPREPLLLPEAYRFPDPRRARLRHHAGDGSVARSVSGDQEQRQRT